MADRRRARCARHARRRRDARRRGQVDLILDKLAAGETIAQIVEAHPRLTEEGIRAALRFAAEAVRAEAVHPLPDAAH